MNRITMIILLFGLNVTITYSEGLNTYQPSEIKQIQIGKRDGQIGYDVYPEGPVIPLTFSISKKNKFYIPDPVNRRLNIYNINLDFLSFLMEEENGEIHWAKYIAIDHNDNIVYINDYLGLRKINSLGRELFTIRSYVLDNQLRSYKNIFIFEDEIYMYNDSLELEILTETGKYETSKNVIEKLKLLTLSENTASKSFELPKGIELPENAVQIIERLRNDGKHLIVGDRFYSTSFRQHQNYYEEIKEVREIVRELNINNRMISGNSSPESAVNIDLDKYYLYFVGYDGDHNSYWDAVERIKVNDIKNYAIVVLDKFGETLDAFYYGQLKGYEYDTEIYPTSGAKLAVAPNGDVWFMVSNSEGHTFYKVNRTWGEPSFEAIAINGLEGDSYSKYVMEVLAELDKNQLRILRNTMFAMEGYKFKSEELTMHFNQYEWYKPDESVKASDSNLSEAQQKLIEEIRRLEQE